jgi:predicted  nucleic acid-binding Zn-ribbon protein
VSGLMDPFVRDRERALADRIERLERERDEWKDGHTATDLRLVQVMAERDALRKELEQQRRHHENRDDANMREFNALRAELAEAKEQRDGFESDSLRLHKDKMDAIDANIALRSQLAAVRGSLQELVTAPELDYENEIVSLFTVHVLERARAALRQVSEGGDAK